MEEKLILFDYLQKALLKIEKEISDFSFEAFSDESGVSELDILEVRKENKSFEVRCKYFVEFATSTTSYPENPPQLAMRQLIVVMDHAGNVEEYSLA